MHKYILICLLSLLTVTTTAKPKQLLDFDNTKQRRSTVEYCTGYNDSSYNFSTYQSKSFNNHALLWKGLVTEGNPDITYIPGFINDANGIIQIIIDEYSHTLLNNHEANSGDFFNSALMPTDPPGSWNQEIIENPDVTMIYAAMNIWKWGTPVFTNINHHDGNYQNIVQEYADDYPEVGVIRCVTLSAVGGPPHLSCGWNTDGSNFLEQASQCDVIIESIVMSTYNTPTLCGSCGVSYSPEQTISPDIYAQLHINANNFPSIFGEKTNRVLLDPPANESTRATLAKMLIASQVSVQNSQLRRD